MATRTWMTTAAGVIIRAMVRAGFRASKPAGLRITTAIGYGLSRGAGLGWMTRPGVLRSSTTAAGHFMEAVGCGFPEPLRCVRFTRRRWSPGSEAHILESGSVLAAVWVGSRSAPAKLLFRRI